MNEIVSIKGTKKGLVILIDEKQDKKTLFLDIEKKMQQARGFFKGASFAIASRSGSELDVETIESIETICRKHGLVPREEQQIVWQSTPNQNLEIQVLNGIVNSEKEFDTKVEYFKGTLRSGCRIESDGDIVLLGDINPNAELVAGGNICVFGTIKGIVHAGATGNRNATIVAYAFLPQQLRIADVYSRNPDYETNISPIAMSIIPEIAYIYNNNILIEKYKDYSARRK